MLFILSEKGKSQFCPSLGFRSVHELGWVFQPKPHKSIHMNWVGPMSWPDLFFNYFINIKLRIRTMLLQIREIYNQIILSITPNQHKLYEKNLGV